jgi:hypothetical protein
MNLRPMASAAGSLAALLCALSGFGCSSLPPMTPVNGGPPTSKPAAFAVFDVDCRDTPHADGATSIVVGENFISCTYKDAPLPWLVVGVFHAGLAEGDDWKSYRANLTANGKDARCPGVALRTFPPSTFGGGTWTGVGALCIDPQRPPAATPPSNPMSAN